jgi:hypothetical protein
MQRRDLQHHVSPLAGATQPAAALLTVAASVSQGSQDPSPRPATANPGAAHALARAHAPVLSAHMGPGSHAAAAHTSPPRLAARRRRTAARRSLTALAAPSRTPAATTAAITRSGHRATRG